MRTVDRKKDRKHVAIVTSLRSDARCCGCARYKWKGMHKQSKEINRGFTYRNPAVKIAMR